MLHAQQRDEVDLSFSIPAACADQLENGQIDVGLVPVAEIARQALEIVPGVGIACRGAVRSILLFSRVPWRQVRTLSADASSRTSVQLARVILRERFGVEPVIAPQIPALNQMLEAADAALIIGDPALRIDPEAQPFEWLDLGAEWFALTRLPMVFAAWAAKPGLPIESLAEVTNSSYRFGKAHVDEIVDAEYARRGITRELAREYLNRHIRFELSAPEINGFRTFLQLANLTHDYSTASA